MRLALGAVSMVALVGCKDEGASTPPPRPMPVAMFDAAAPSPDAAIGPILDLVGCAPAPLPTAEPAKAAKLAPPRLTFGVTKESGVKGAGALLRKHENRLRYCYEQNLARVPALAGTSTLQIILTETGFPHEIILDDGFDPELTLCLKHIVMELQFPKPAKAPVTIVQPVTFAWTPSKQPATAQASEPTAWMPYSLATSIVPNEIAIPAALALQKAMPTAKLATCLGPQHTGSLRTVARVGTDGRVIAARAGGFADKTAEACMAEALVGVSTESVGAVTDVTCDFVRGDPAPWRVAPDAGYTLLDAVPRQTETPFAATPDDASATFLVLIAPGTKPERLAAALARASRGAGYVVAMETGENLPPLFLLAGRGSVALADPSSPMTLDTREPLRVCGGLLDAPASAPFSDADKLLAGAARRCTRKPCPTPLTISLGRTTDELAQLVAAARRAGFERIRLGAGACPK